MRQYDLKNISILYSFCQIFVRAFQHISVPFITDIVRKLYDFFWKTNTKGNSAELVWPGLNRGDRGDQVYSLLGFICLSARDLFHPLSSEGSGVNGEWKSVVSKKTLQRYTCLAFHIPSLVWDSDEKVRKWPDLTGKTDIFCQKGNVNLTSGQHMNKCLFLSPRLLLSQLLGGRHPERGTSLCLYCFPW